MLGEINNDTSRPIFYLVAFSTSGTKMTILITAVLLIYLLILSGNLLIISLICLEPQLHTSMYFFLCNLSTLDILFVSTTLPKLIYISHTGDHVLSTTGCLVQFYLYLLFSDTECYLLTAMAIDRYVAICFPLHYTRIMNKKFYVLLAFPAWFMASINASIATYLAYNLIFCGLIEIQNFFCDLKALLFSSIYDTSTFRIFSKVDGLFTGAIPLCLIFTSYVCIIHTVLKIKSSHGRWKTFSSCSSHITIVVVYFGSATCLYMTNSLEQDLIFSMMFVILVPMLNPLVYSLRNKDIKRALRRLQVKGKITWLP